MLILFASYCRRQRRFAAFEAFSLFRFDIFADAFAYAFITLMPPLIFAIFATMMPFSLL